MTLPKDAIAAVAKYVEAFAQDPTNTFPANYIDEKQLEDLAQFCDLANARITELFTENTQLKLKIHRIQHALKE